MDEVERIAKERRPKLILAGWSAYPRLLDFERFRAIADEVGALLMVDMAHFAGLVAAGLHPSPVPYADVVTTTIHKTIGGARGGMILCREEYAKKINSAVFPGQQGGPLEHVIAGKAVALQDRRSRARSASASSARSAGAKARRRGAARRAAHGVNVLTGGTDVHLVLVDLRESELDGQQAEDRLHDIGITVNRNAVPFDPRPPMVTSGLRVGTPALATRGLQADDFAEVGRHHRRGADAGLRRRAGRAGRARRARSPSATRSTRTCGVGAQVRRPGGRDHRLAMHVSAAASSRLRRHVGIRELRLERRDPRARLRRPSGLRPRQHGPRGARASGSAAAARRRPAGRPCGRRQAPAVRERRRRAGGKRHRRGSARVARQRRRRASAARERRPAGDRVMQRRGEARTRPAGAAPDAVAARGALLGRHVGVGADGSARRRRASSGRATLRSISRGGAPMTTFSGLTSRWTMPSAAM